MRVDYRIVITGIICLTAIYICLLLTKNVDGTIGALVVGIIALATGVVLPSPTVDNKRGVLTW
jgi:hypothetical protein